MNEDQEKRERQAAQDARAAMCVHFNVGHVVGPLDVKDVDQTADGHRRIGMTVECRSCRQAFYVLVHVEPGWAEDRVSALRQQCFEALKHKVRGLPEGSVARIA